MAQELQKLPHEMTLQEFQEAGHEGYIEGHRDSIIEAIRRGDTVPPHVIDLYAATVEESERRKLREKYGQNFEERLKQQAQLYKEISGAKQQTDGSYIIRRRQASGGSFIDLAKGNIILIKDKPYLVTKALKPYKARADGEIYGYFQKISVKPAGLNGELVVNAAKALMDNGRPGNRDYPDLKRQQMARYASLVAQALST